MPSPTPQKPKEERDLIDAVPGLDRFGSRLQRSLGPSCLVSLIITALLLVLLRRFLKFGPTGIFILTVFIWWVIMVILVRFGKAIREDD